MSTRSRLRIGLAILCALFPRRVTPLLLRVLLRYDIGKNVRIGFSIIDVASCSIGDNTMIGHGNLATNCDSLSIGNGCKIGYLNIFRGGESISIGDNCEFLRLNVVNSIVEPEVNNPYSPTFQCADKVTVTQGHRIDFTDGVSIGQGTILAGRNSSLWTHARQSTQPITIGDSCYLGSEIRIGPGVNIAQCTIVAMGAVVVDSFDKPNKVIGGVPARVIKDVGQDNSSLIRTMPDQTETRTRKAK